MAALSLVFVLTLVFPVQGFFVQEKAQDFFDCGDFQCVNETGVTCHNNRRCLCPSGQLGDARIQCADPRDKCVCTLGGDPHMMTFVGQAFSLALPCTHKIVEMVTKTPDFPKGCSVSITGMALYGGAPSGHPLGAFESQIEISVFAGGTSYSGNITRHQDPIFDLHGLDFEVKKIKEPGLTIIEVPKCELTIKYKDDRAFLSVLTSGGNTTSSGLCGECGLLVNNPPAKMDEFDALKLLLNSLASSPESQYVMCSGVSGMYSVCPEDRKDQAVRFCGSYLFQEGARNCLYESKGDPEDLIDFFQDCITRACQFVECSRYGFLLNPCSFDGADKFMNDPSFCFHTS